MRPMPIIAMRITGPNNGLSRRIFVLLSMSEKVHTVWVFVCSVAGKKRDLLRGIFIGPPLRLLLLLGLGLIGDCWRWPRVIVRHPRLMPARCTAIDQSRGHAYATEILGCTGAAFA